MVQREFTTLGISANRNTSVKQRGEPGQAPVTIPPLKQTNSSHLGPRIPVDVVEPQNVHADGHFHYGFDVGEEQG